MKKILFLLFTISFISFFSCSSDDSLKSTGENEYYKLIQGTWIGSGSGNITKEVFYFNTMMSLEQYYSKDNSRSVSIGYEIDKDSIYLDWVYEGWTDYSYKYTISGKQLTLKSKNYYHILTKEN